MKYLFVAIVVVLISCNRGKTPTALGAGFKSEYSAIGNELAIVDSVNRAIVYGPVLDYKYDSAFIIVIDKPRDSIPGCKGTYKECEEAFNKSTFKQYWIIKKKTHRVFGPYKIEEYNRLKDSLRVPRTLDFQ